MRWIFYHGVFGDWGWEKLDDSGRVIAESRACFESRKDAESDAALHGYVPASPGMGARRPDPGSGDRSSIRSAIAASVAPVVNVAAAPPSIQIPPAAELASSETMPSTR